MMNAHVYWNFFYSLPAICLLPHCTFCVLFRRGSWCVSLLELEINWFSSRVLFVSRFVSFVCVSVHSLSLTSFNERFFFASFALFPSIVHTFVVVFSTLKLLMRWFLPSILVSSFYTFILLLCEIFPSSHSCSIHHFTRHFNCYDFFCSCIVIYLLHRLCRLHHCCFIKFFFTSSLSVSVCLCEYYFIVVSMHTYTLFKPTGNLR